MNLKIGTAGFRYRVAYGRYAKARSWSVMGAGAYPMLVIGPKAVFIDPHAVEREVARLQRDFPHVDAFARAKENALHQLGCWQCNLHQILERHIAARRVLRDDLRRSAALIEQPQLEAAQ